MTSANSDLAKGQQIVTVKAGNSAVQVAAELEILAALASTLGIQSLGSTSIALADGVAIQVDGCDEARSTVVEAYARQGALKGAQMKKIAQDILKLSLVREKYPHARLIIAFASDEACNSIRGWVLHAARVHRIELLVVDIPEATRQTILAAQERQYR
jgi:hypothetical protein